jgi:hypothetical protein
LLALDGFDLPIRFPVSFFGLEEALNLKGFLVFVVLFL